MKAELISFTPKPIDLVYDRWWHDKYGEDRSGDGLDAKWCFVLDLLKEDWCGLTEFPNFAWAFEVPRSLHAQIRVHRHWSFFSQSHQLHEPSRFFKDGEHFQIPDTTQEQQSIEFNAMAHCEDAYCQLLASGMLPSLARGVLPMHINLGLSASCNLRSLFNVVVERRCHILQGTYWNPLLEMMKQELMEKVDSRLGAIFELQPCDVTGSCLSPIEQEMRLASKDPHVVCPRYKELKRSSGLFSCCDEGCDGCLCHATKNHRKVQRENRRQYHA